MYSWKNLAHKMSERSFMAVFLSQKSSIVKNFFVIELKNKLVDIQREKDRYKDL
jgi:hypothetical protein